MTTTKYINISNNQVIDLKDIPEHNYGLFAELNLDLMQGNPARHCVNYFGYPVADKIKLICCIADDDLHQVFVSSSIIEKNIERTSLTAKNANFEKFERELHENYGINYNDH